MAERKYKTYEEFWPYYVGEHSNATCRNLHFVGTSLAILNLVLAIVTLNPWHLLGAVISGYFFAWLGHFVFEKNRPATFTYPLWSLRGDFRMYFLMLTGRMSAEIARLRTASAA